MTSRNNKKDKSKEKSRSREKQKNEEESPHQEKIENFQIDILKQILTDIIPLFCSSDYEIIRPIFGDREIEYQNLIINVAKEHRSDCIICYGNNNQVLKVFLDKYIENTKEENKYIKININGYFDTNEEVLLKEICNKLNIDCQSGLAYYKEALNDFFNNGTQDDSLIIIYCDYIDHLVQKKKQRLLYILFELINNSKNILLIGFTYNYNLLDQMEKRIRSRFSQKTMYISIDKFHQFVAPLEKIFTKKDFNENKKKAIYSKGFFNLLISDGNEEFVFYLEKMVKLGMSIDGILNKIKYYLVKIKCELDEFRKLNDIDYITKKELEIMLSSLIKNIIEKEEKGNIHNILMNFSKLNLSLFICLYKCVSEYKDRIYLSLFYNEYKSIVKNRINKKKSNYDLILIQKFLEELNNCNVITIKNDEKYGKIYQLKFPICEIKKVIESLKENNKIDSEMASFLNSIK